MNRGAVWAILFVTACGGGKPPAEAPQAETPKAEEPESASSEPGTAEKAESEGDAKKPSSGDESASSEDRTKALQVVIDDEELEKFLKLGQPGRFPLKIAGSDIPSGLTKATKPVEVVSGAKSEKDAVLVFTKIEINGAHGTASYRYDIEGVRGSASMKKGAYGWELTHSRIVER